MLASVLVLLISRCLSCRIFALKHALEPLQDSISCVTVLEEEGNCIICLEMRADELMRRLISGGLTNYSVVRTSPEPLHHAPISHDRF
jgi:hypothetical protein